MKVKLLGLLLLVGCATVKPSESTSIITTLHTSRIFCEEPLRPKHVMLSVTTNFETKAQEVEINWFCGSFIRSYIVIEDTEGK